MALTEMQPHINGNHDNTPESPDTQANGMEPIEVEILDLCVRMAQFLGLPKSMGEIYGIVFISSKPLTMEDVIERLDISKGSASQGLRALKTIGALKTQYVPRSRKDHYVAETGLGHLVSGLLRDRFEPGIADFGARLESIKERELSSSDEKKQKHLQNRLNKLVHWQSQAEMIIPTLRQILGR